MSFRLYNTLFGRFIGYYDDTTYIKKISLHEYDTIIDIY